MVVGYFKISNVFDLVEMIFCDLVIVEMVDSEDLVMAKIVNFEDLLIVEMVDFDDLLR